MESTIEQKIENNNSLLFGSISKLITQMSDKYGLMLDNFCKSHLEKQNYRVQTYEEAMASDMEKAVLEQTATHDALTGLANRRYFNQRLSDEIGLSNRYGSVFSLVLMDLKKFKHINDHYGHSAGDAALIHFANLLNVYTRNVDFAARTGGDEFALILPETGIKQAGNLITRLNDIVDNTSFNYNGHDINVHANMGVVEMKEGYTPKQLYDLADSASIASKNHSGKVYYADFSRKRIEPISNLLKAA